LKKQGCMPIGGSQVNFGQNKQTCRWRESKNGSTENVVSCSCPW
jgi:hypothetical protein